ncbi:MAG: hypothetical protein KBD78_15585, partial [Oligoflexales bacterium]|nr:hypothetical protein [Oligoflexales bacterium]
MASRLSADSDLKSYSIGSRILKPAKNWLLQQIDKDLDLLNSYVQTDKAQELVQALPPGTLHRALHHADIELQVEVLPLISEEQWLRLVVCDAWIHDELSLSALSKWLKLYQQIDHVQAFERFKQLDEEYQL